MKFKAEHRHAVPGRELYHNCPYCWEKEHESNCKPEKLVEREACYIYMSTHGFRNGGVK
jgi:hypothetical protein